MIKANVGYLIAYQKFGIKSFESAAYRMLCARSLFRLKRHMLALNVDKAHRYHIHRYSGMISYDFCCVCVDLALSKFYIDSCALAPIHTYRHMHV